MVKLIKNDIFKIKILKIYKKHNKSYTASYLSKIINCKFETIVKALEFYCQIGILKKEVKDYSLKHYTYYNLTELGQVILDSLK